MKKLCLSALAVSVSLSSAIAADLPTRKEPLLAPPPPPSMWTGFYAGLNAGYGFGTNSNTQSIGLLSPLALLPVNNGFGYVDTGVGYALSGYSAQNQNGFIGGGQVGYNYQWGSNFLIGIEADMQGAGIRSSSRANGIGGSVITYSETLYDIITITAFRNYSSTGTTNINAGVNWMGTVRGRLGYLWTPTMLVYATGGLTYGGVYANVSNSAVEGRILLAQINNDTPFETDRVSRTYIGGGSRSQTLVGWNVGGGLEWMFMPNWSLKTEGLYWNMGSQNVATVAYSAPIFPDNSGNYNNTPQTVIGGTRVNYQGVVARMGVNYHFNFGGFAPIVAKY